MTDAHSSPPRSGPSEAPDSPARTDTASHVQDALRLGGGLIAVVQSILFPLLSIPISVPALTLAGTMMASGQAVKITREKRS